MIFTDLNNVRYASAFSIMIQCSDIYPPLRVALWMELTEKDIAELYREAEAWRS